MNRINLYRIETLHLVQSWKSSYFYPMREIIHLTNELFWTNCYSAPERKSTWSLHLKNKTYYLPLIKNGPLSYRRKTNSDNTSQESNSFYILCKYNVQTTISHYLATSFLIGSRVSIIHKRREGLVKTKRKTIPAHGWLYEMCYIWHKSYIRLFHLKWKISLYDSGWWTWYQGPVLLRLAINLDGRESSNHSKLTNSYLVTTA